LGGAGEDLHDPRLGLAIFAVQPLLDIVSSPAFGKR